MSGAIKFNSSAISYERIIDSSIACNRVWTDYINRCLARDNRSAVFLSIIYRFRLCLILGACSLGRYLDNSPNTRFVFKATQLKTGTITIFKGFSA